MPRWTAQQKAEYEARFRPAVQPSPTVIEPPSEHERELHDTFERWLKINEIPYVHSRMDRKPTIRAGWPDFTIMRNGKCVCIEFKTSTGFVSDDQEKVHAELRAANVPLLVTTNVVEAINFTKENL